MEQELTERKSCPFCGESIQAAAIVCRYCHFDTTAKYEECNQCAELIKANANACRYCSYRRWSGVDEIKDEQKQQEKKPEQSLTGFLFGRKRGANDEIDGPFGSGVRAQVFEVIVRQGMAGAPWRQICKGPMQVNDIHPDEVEAEIRRRQNLLS